MHIDKEYKSSAKTSKKIDFMYQINIYVKK